MGAKAKTSEQVKAEFISDFCLLMKKHNASFSANHPEMLYIREVINAQGMLVSCHAYFLFDAVAIAPKEVDW
jgi:hypothetical protein